MVKMRFFNSEPNLFSFLWSHLNAIFGLATVGDHFQLPQTAIIGRAVSQWTCATLSMSCENFEPQVQKKSQVSSLPKKNDSQVA